MNQKFPFLHAKHIITPTRERNTRRLPCQQRANNNQTNQAKNGKWVDLFETEIAKNFTKCVYIWECV